MLRNNNGRRVVSVQFTRGYRVAMAHARRSLRLVEEDLRFEQQQMAEEIEALRAGKTRLAAETRPIESRFPQFVMFLMSRSIIAMSRSKVSPRTIAACL